MGLRLFKYGTSFGLVICLLIFLLPALPDALPAIIKSLIGFAGSYLLFCFMEWLYNGK